MSAPWLVSVRGVTAVPGIAAGAPCIEGTRVPVTAVCRAFVEGGLTIDQVAATAPAHGSLTRLQVESALRFGLANRRWLSAQLREGLEFERG